MSACIVYVTCKHSNEAVNIARIILGEKLAACANIIPETIAIFEWNGNINENKECVLILKSVEQSLERLTQRVKDLHSYDVPCILSFPIQGGNSTFIEWINRNVNNIL